MQRGGAPVAVEKIEQASSAKIFSGTARRRGQIRRGYLWSASVRSTDLDFSFQKNLNPYPAQLSVKRDCQGGSSVPLDRILVPFVRTKGTPPRRAVLTMPLQKAPPRRRRDEMIALMFAVNPSVSLAADSLSLRLGHGAALICHWHIIHYRAATSLPLTQGSLWVCRQARRNLFSPITKKKQPFGCFFLVGPAGFGPAGCGSQSPVPYRLATAQSISQGIPE